MLTISHHPRLQHLLDRWQTRLSPSDADKRRVATEEDLRILIKEIEDLLDIVLKELGRQAHKKGRRR
jgi:hypothetical protein